MRKSLIAAAVVAAALVFGSAGSARADHASPWRGGFWGAPGWYGGGFYRPAFGPVYGPGFYGPPPPVLRGGYFHPRRGFWGGPVRGRGIVIHGPNLGFGYFR